MNADFRFVARKRDGVTLIELIVVLAILGLAAGVAGLVFRSGRHASTASIMAMERIDSSRHEAITSGHDVSITVELNERSRAVTAFVDGRVIADSLPSLDPMSGRSTAEPLADVQR